MNEIASEHTMRIIARNQLDVESGLERAVSLFHEKAMTERRPGILVTHDAPGRFTVALSDDVPFGLTQEQRAW